MSNQNSNMSNITEQLLQKIEEKTIVLLTEIEKLRHEVVRLTHEHTVSKKEYETEREICEKKLRDLLSLIDTSTTPTPIAIATEEAAVA